MTSLARVEGCVVLQKPVVSAAERVLWPPEVVNVRLAFFDDHEEMPLGMKVERCVSTRQKEVSGHAFGIHSVRMAVEKGSVSVEA